MDNARQFFQVSILLGSPPPIAPSLQINGLAGRWSPLSKNALGVDSWILVPSKKAPPRGDHERGRRRPPCKSLTGLVEILAPSRDAFGPKVNLRKVTGATSLPAWTGTSRCIPRPPTN
jgi:hypothetical protein